MKDKDKQSNWARLCFQSKAERIVPLNCEVDGDNFSYVIRTTDCDEIKCTNCNEDLNSDWEFCPYCGEMVV